MRLLVCGSRNWDDQKIVDIVLRGFLFSYKHLEIIEGCAPGGDHAGEVFAEENTVPNHHFRADWGKYGNGAGHIRNQQMLDEGHPQAVVAFKDNFNGKKGYGGTEDMVRRAKEAGIPVFVISHGEGV